MSNGPARRLAAGLRERGVGPGDVVAMQLPNWMEAAASFWAAALLGAVVVPIVHFYGHKELAYILGDAKPKVFITAASFGHLKFDPSVVTEIPIVGVVGGKIQRWWVENRRSRTLADEPMAGCCGPIRPARR